MTAPGRSDGVSARAAALAGAAPAEGAGVVAAAVCELVAGLCESLVRGQLAGGPVELRGLAVQAADLRERSARAAGTNAVAYARARDLLDPGPVPGRTGRDGTLRAALLDAADSLLVVAALAGDCAGLAAELVPLCPASLRADAAGAAEMASGAVRAAAGLVEVNLALLSDDDRRLRARAIAAGAAEDCGRAHAAAADA